MSQLLTAREAGKRLNISARAVYALIERDLLPYSRTERGLTLVPEVATEGLALTYDEISDLVRRKKHLLASSQKESTHENEDTKTR